MMRLLIAALAGAIATSVAADPSPAGDAFTRQMWQSQKVDSIETVQRVYNRVVTFKLPRPFVMVTRAEQRGFYIVEYVPDGQTVENWTRMITVTGKLGLGAAHVDDVELAARFDPGACPHKVFRDLGPTVPLAGVTGRMVVIGCGAADEAGAERGAIAVYRDHENGWTVQYAERNHGKPPFAPEAAVARLKALEAAVIPALDTVPGKVR